ncbi:uncharacterized protein WCC33_006088 [Rhinophrynus dorsalis]
MQVGRLRSLFSSQGKVGGRLSHFSHQWASITSDQWVLQTVTGYHIEFYASPVQQSHPIPLRFASSDTVLVDREVADLWRKAAIQPVPDNSAGFLSNIFLVRKKDSGLRPVINLRALNGFVLYRHFKMEGIHCLRDLLLPSDWMVKIDLKDAYLTVPMAPTSQTFLRFFWNGQIWQFTCLPFGLSSAPWCFTKLLKPVVHFLRSRGVRMIIYLDDMLIMSQDKERLLSHTELTLRLLTSLGFLINWDKSVLVPSRSMEFLGFLTDSVHTSLSLPAGKVRSIRRELRVVLRKGRFSLRTLARIVGLLAASIQAIFPGPLHYRALQRLKARHLQRGLGYSDVIALSSDAREELVWWLKHLDAWNGRAIFGVAPDIVIESDASLVGWGARRGLVSTGGRWSLDERDLHINYLELLAGSFALKSLAGDRVDCCVLLRMDNVSAVRYVNRLGGTRSKPLAELARDFWHFCLDRNIMVQAEYLPGLSNAVADWNSRFLSDRSDWMLHGQVFSSLEGLWGPLHVDLFASRLNRRLPRFFSWRPDPEALAVDAFLQPWFPDRNYAFPPFALIARTILAVRRQAAGAGGGHPTSATVIPSSPGGSVGFTSRVGPGQVASVDGLAHFRGRESAQSLSQSAQFLLAESWAPGTRAMYQSAWSAWHRWCMARDLDPVSAAPVAVVNFLSSLFDQGKAYRTINMYRSAISAGHMPVDGAPVGQCPVVCRLLRGIRFSRPPQSRYQSLWDVNLVLDFLEAWPPNGDLSLKQLSAKLTMLLCLISFRRVADVHALDLHRRSFVPEGVRFDIRRRTKSNSRSILYPAFPLRPQLCVVRCLQEYELRTVDLRCSNWPQLLISFRKPHFPVSTASLARWVRWVMHLAGIDVTLFGAHSSRGAVASRTFQAGGRLEDILRAADWSRESTFREFYFKPMSHVSNDVVMQL